MDIEILTVQVFLLANMFSKWVSEEEQNQQVWEYFMQLDKFLRMLSNVRN